MASLITGGLGSPFPPLYLTGGLGVGAAVTPFTVSTASSLAALVVRVTFTNDPLAFDPGSSDDALHIANYALTGPVPTTIIATAPVTGNQRAIDLYLGAPLAAGTWTVTVSDSVKDITAVPLGEPLEASFLVVVNPPATSVSGGAVDEGVLRRHLNPVLRGDAWDALILAVEGDADHVVGDTYVSRTARAAYDQLFLTSASGSFLDRRAGEVGVQRPAGVGLGDEPFRELALALATRRLTDNALHDVLEVFYGPDALRATLTTGTEEPFALRDGDDLTLYFGPRVVTVPFLQSAFARIATASAVEVAAAIDRAMRAAGVRGRAAAVADPGSGLGRVRVYADARGIPSVARAGGGRAQVALRFPEDLFPVGDVSSPFGSWNIAVSPDEPGRMRLSASASSPYDLSRVRVGDLALIYGREFPAALQGTHTILEVSVSYPGGTRDEWFELEGTAGATTVAQLTEGSMVFLRSTLRTIHDQSNRAYVASVPGGLEAVLPATTAVVVRGDGRAGYLAVADALEISALTRDALGVVTVTTTTTHGLAVGDRVLVDGVRADVSMPATSAGTPSGTLGASHLP